MTARKFPCANPPCLARPERSPRDPRRVWMRLSRRPRPFTNPTAGYLAAWADAVLFLETWAAWQASHSEGGPL